VVICGYIRKTEIKKEKSKKNPPCKFHSIFFPIKRLGIPIVLGENVHQFSSTSQEVCVSSLDDLTWNYPQAKEIVELMEG